MHSIKCNRCKRAQLNFWETKRSPQGWNYIVPNKRSWTRLEPVFLLGYLLPYKVKSFCETIWCLWNHAKDKDVTVTPIRNLKDNTSGDMYQKWDENPPVNTEENTTIQTRTPGKIRNVIGIIDSSGSGIEITFVNWHRRFQVMQLLWSGHGLEVPEPEEPQQKQVSSWYSSPQATRWAFNVKHWKLNPLSWSITSRCNMEKVIDLPV